jgi:hypothetical protein
VEGRLVVDEYHNKVVSRNANSLHVISVCELKKELNQRSINVAHQSNGLLVGYKEVKLC